MAVWRSGLSREAKAEPGRRGFCQLGSKPAYGVLSPAAKWRSQIVPVAPDTEAAEGMCSHAPATGRSDRVAAPRPRNHSGSQLMRRVFAIDVLEWPQCRGPMKILSAIQSPDAILKILNCLGLPSGAPPVAPAVPGGNPQLEWA